MPFHLARLVLVRARIFGRMTSYPTDSADSRDASLVDPGYLTDFLVRTLAYPTPATEHGEGDDQILGFLEELVASELEQLGLDFVDFDEMGNVCGLISGADRSQASVLLVGFAMTHPGASMPDPFSPRIIDGSELGEQGSVVVGRGAGEQKGPLAAMVAALETLQRTGTRPSSDVHLVVLASGETGRHDAIRSAVDHFRLESAGAIVGVCTGNDIVIGHKGRVDVEVRVRGESAHSSSPDLGLNALLGANEVIRLLGTVDLGEPDPDLGPRLITPVALETSPNAPHTIPDLATIHLDCRMLPGDAPEDIISRVSAAISDIDDYAVEVQAGDVMYASNVASDAWLVEALVSAVERTRGSAPSLRRIPAATDSGFLNAHGIPAVLFGPGDISKAHTDTDYVAVEEAIEAAQSLVHFLSD